MEGHCGRPQPTLTRCNVTLYNNYAGMVLKLYKLCIYFLLIPILVIEMNFFCSNKTEFNECGGVLSEVICIAILCLAVSQILVNIRLYNDIFLVWLLVLRNASLIIILILTVYVVVIPMLQFFHDITNIVG